MSKERLKKIMMLATSDNDHEALSALRKANAILNASNITWAQVIDLLGEQNAAPQARPITFDDIDVDALWRHFQKGGFRF